MGRDSATFWDKGTEVPSLSRDKGTTGQAQNLAMGRDGPGHPVKIWDGMRDGTITIFLSKSGTERDNHYFFPIIFCFRTSLGNAINSSTTEFQKVVALVVDPLQAL